MGGGVLTRLDYAGNKWKTEFSIDGLLTAVQYGVSYLFQNATVQWTQVDPLGLSEAGNPKPVHDPVGNYIPWQHVPTAPPNAYPPSAGSLGGQSAGFGASQDKSCVFNGEPISCTELEHKIDIGIVGFEYLRGGQRHKGRTGVDGAGTLTQWVQDDGPLTDPNEPPKDPDTDIKVVTNDDGLGHYESFLLSVAPQNSFAQKRSDTTGDRDIKPPKINVTYEGLTPCVKEYLARFFDKKLLDQIIIHRDELPAIVPGKDDTAAYTANEREVWFNKGQYSPNTSRGIERIGHEVEHAYQWRKYGVPFGLLYLGDSAGVFVATGNPDLAYPLNRFEIAARKKEKQISDDIDKNGNPCP